jgi:hypothetical protein
VDLELLLWVRPRRVKETLAAAEMFLAAGFPLVVADFGLSARGGRFVPDAAWIRLGRASQAQDSALLLLTPYRMSGIAAEAVVTADTARPLWQGTGATPRLLTALSSRLTLQKLARTTPGTSQTLRLSVPASLLPLPAGEGRVSGLQSQIANHKSQILVMPGNPSKPESKLMIRETPCRSMTAR